LLSIRARLSRQAPILSRRKVFEASAHGYLKIEYRTLTEAPVVSLRAQGFHWVRIFNLRTVLLLGGATRRHAASNSHSLGSMRNAHQAHWVRIFKLARAPHRELSNRRLASFFQPPASPKLASLRKTAVFAKLVPQKTPFVRPSLRICATRPSFRQTALYERQTSSDHAVLGKQRNCLMK